MRTILDDTGRTAGIIRGALVPALHSELIDETHRMLEAGAKIEDIVWLLHPGGGIADRRQELEGDAPPPFDEVMRVLPERVAGKMLVVYIGPEGILMQRWNSILTAQKGAS